MAKDTLAINGILLLPAGMNDSSPLDAENNWYVTQGVHSLAEQCLQRCKGKNLYKKYNSPILGIHGNIKDYVFVETVDALYLISGSDFTPPSETESITFNDTPSVHWAFPSIITFNDTPSVHWSN